MGQILDTSITVLLWRKFYKWYNSMEQRISFICLNSQTFRLTKWLRKGIKTCFRYSFLGKVSEIKEANPAVFDNSRVVRYLIAFYKRWRDEAIYYSKTSSTVNLAEDTKEQFVLSPAKLISIIIVTAILANVVLSIILHKQIGLWGWLMRGLFLFTSISGLFCPADWVTIKESSVFLRRERRR